MDDVKARWLRSRIGHLTASRMADAIKFRKDGKPGAARTKLMHNLLAERITDSAIEHYVTLAMRHGIDNEPLAFDRYEAASGNIVSPTGFVLHKQIAFFGATPDGAIDGDGLIEIKCPTTAKYIAWRASSDVPDEHKPQMLAQLACTGRSYVDFVAFDTRIKDYKAQVFIRRFEPHKSEIERIEEAAIKFLAELDKLFEAFTESGK